MSPFLCENQRKRESRDKGKGIKAGKKNRESGRSGEKGKSFFKKKV